MTIEEAAELTVPIGDLELERMRAGPQVEPSPIPRTGLDGTPQEEYGVGTAWDIGKIRVGQAVDTAQAGAGLYEARLNRQALREKAGEDTLLPSFSQAVQEQPAIVATPIGAMPNWQLALDTGTDWVAAKLAAAFRTEEELAAAEGRALQFTEKQIKELEVARNKLAALPQNTVTAEAIAAFDNGDYWEFAKRLPQVSLYTTIEQAPVMAAQAALTGGTALATRNPVTTARVAQTAGALGGLSEIGSDFEYLLGEMSEEDRNDPEKLYAAWKQARNAAGARTLIETIIPGQGLGKSLPTKVATLVGGQMASEAGGEVAASEMLGRDYTAGEIAIEAFAGIPQVAVESGGVIRSHNEQLRAAEDRARAEQAERDFAIQDTLAQLRQQEADQRLAEANRAEFDAELEADRALQEVAEANRRKFDAEQMAGATQMELPFGSDMSGDRTQNDRPVMIQDMFSGETMTATKAEQRRQGNVEEAEALARGEPNLTDAEFENRKIAESRARRQVDRRQQEDFEQQKAAEETNRRRLVEAETTLKRERQLLSTSDITREAKRLLEIEQEGVRNQRKGIARTPEQMEAILKAYERKRLPELVENVRNRRLEEVNNARDLIIAEENRKLEEPMTPAQAADSFNSQPRSFTGQPTAISPGFRPENRPTSMEDLLPTGQEPLPRGQGQLDLQSPDAGQLFAETGTGYTGSLTDEQAAAEAQRIAGDRQRTLAERAAAKKTAEAAAKKAEAEKAKQMEEVLAPELGLVDEALNKEKEKRATYTAKKYAAEEKKALQGFIKDVLDNRGDRTDEQVREDVATLMALWRKDNPRPAGVPAATTQTPMVERAKKAAEAIEADKKRAETRKVNRQLKNEIKKGATPEEAAAAVENRVLTSKEDADLRKTLTETKRKKGSEDTSRIENSTPGGVKFYEDAPVRAAIDRELQNPRPSIARVLEAIANDPKASRGERWLASKLAPLARASGVRLVPIPENSPIVDRAGGVYDKGNNTIWIQAGNRETVLHEVLHAVTSNLLFTPSAARNPIVRAALDKLTQAMQVANLALANGEIQLDSEVTQRRWDQATANVREFLAHGLTERGFIRMLDAIDMPGQKKTTVWQAFKDAVSSLFRPRTTEQGSVLDAIIEATSMLTDEVSPSDRFRANLEARVLLGRNDLSELETTPTGRIIPSTKTFTLGGALRPEWKNTPVEAIADLLTAGGGRVNPRAGTKSAIVESLERASSDTGALIHRAEQLFKAMRYGLEKKAYLDKKPIDFYNKPFDEAVAKFENATGRVTKAQLARELRKEYGSVARAYFKARRTIDSLSNDILQQRLDDPRPFTTEEAKIYTSIKENMGRYYTRVYAAHTKGIGAKYAKRLWREFEKVLGGSTKQEYQDGFNIVNNAISYVADNHLLIPDDMDEMSMSSLQELAKAWGVRVEGTADFDNVPDIEQRREYLVERLSAIRDGNDQARYNRAQFLVEELLKGKQGGALVNFYRGNATDRTIVEKRQMVPEEIRKLLGEYEDMPLKAMSTIIRMAAFRSKTRAFNEIYESQLGTTVLTPDQFNEANMTADEWQRLEGEIYGALDGMYVRRDIAQSLEATVEITRTFDQLMAEGEKGSKERVKAVVGAAAEGWMKFAGMVKGAQLVWNISNAVFNYAGGGIAMLSNGNVDPRTLVKAHSVAKQLVAAQTTSSQSKEVEKIIRAGITDSALLGAIRKVELDKLDEVLFSSLRSGPENWARRKTSAFKDMGRTWREVYAMADVVWKIANFYNEEARLKEYYTAEGLDVSPEMIEREAAWRTNMSNFSYKRVPNLIKDIEKGGLTYVMPYVYEVFRAPAGSVIVAISDLQKAAKATNPKARNAALRAGSSRLIGAAMSMGIMQQLAYMAAQTVDEMFGGEDEEWIDKMRVLLPDYKKFGDFLYLGRNEEGEPVMLEFSRLDPFGPLTEFYRMAAKGAEPEEYLDAVKNLVIANPYGKGLLQTFFSQGSTNTRMEDISPEAYSTLVNALGGGDFGKRVVKGIDQILPSAFVRPFDPNNKSVDDDGVGEAFGQLMRVLGTQFYNLDPVRTTNFASLEYKNEMKDAKELIYTRLKTDPSMDRNDLLSTLSEAYEIEQGAVEKMADLYDGLIAIGYTPQQILAQMKKSGNMSDQELAVFALGYSPAYSSLISEQGLVNSYKDAVDKGATPERVERFRNNIATLVGLVREGRVAMKE